MYCTLIYKQSKLTSRNDMQRLSDHDGAMLYEALKAGVKEEYGISRKRLNKLIEQILK